jgi:hypothetical protein
MTIPDITSQVLKFSVILDEVLHKSHSMLQLMTSPPLAHLNLNLRLGGTFIAMHNSIPPVNFTSLLTLKPQNSYHTSLFFYDLYFHHNMFY